MTEVVVEVGPGTIRGSGDVAAELVSAALECIDDDIALVGEHPVALPHVWREVMRSAVGSSADRALLVCPAWWPSHRLSTVRDAATAATANIVVLQRARVLADKLPTRRWTMVEIAPDCVVVSHPGAAVAVIPRSSDPDAVVEAVAGEVDSATAVLVDAPTGVNGADPLGVAIADRVRAGGVVVSVADQDWVLHTGVAMGSGQHRHESDAGGDERPWRDARVLLALVGTLAAIAALCGAVSIRHDDPLAPPDGVPMTLLVEGRVGVKVPAQWSLQRITEGPGSARVQLVSPADNRTALHVTQTLLPTHQSLATTAESLLTALGEQPAGVFVEFNASDHRADRPAVTYREVRAERHIEWVVLVDDTVRIGIGCQSPADREDLVRHACDQAIQSAHVVF